MTKEQELLPCPFCGGKGKCGFRLAPQPSAWVSCTKCKSQTPMRLMKSDDTDIICKKDVIKIWNNRKGSIPLSALDGMVGKVAEAIEAEWIKPLIEAITLGINTIDYTKTFHNLSQAAINAIKEEVRKT